MNQHELSEAGKEVERTGCVKGLSRQEHPALRDEKEARGLKLSESERWDNELRLKRHLVLVGQGKD